SIPETNIWFEINPRPTTINHHRQEESVTPKVSRLMEELCEEKRKLEQSTKQCQQQRLEAEAANQRASNAEAELAESRQLINDLQNQVSRLELNQQQLQVQLNNSRDLVRDLLTEQGNQRWPSQVQRQVTGSQQTVQISNFVSIRQLSRSPTTKAHRFLGGPCPVCLEQFENCPSIVSTQCGHLMCEDCMYGYVRNSDRDVRERCPVCRSQLAQNYYHKVLYN
ncbi:E3 ubiquitin- ligase RNF4 isoform X1, partial [Brachionus plicatilis]